MKTAIKNNLSDKEFDELFEKSRKSIITERDNLSPDERKRIDHDPTLERWAGETDTTNEGEE